MTCEMCKPLLSEYTDGRLDAGQREQIDAHLRHCSVCTAIVGDFQTMGGLLRDLPIAKTSSAFEARLAERLAQKRARPAQHPWLRRLADWSRPTPAVWRPALALSAAAAMIGGVFAFQHPAVVVDTPQPVLEGALVTQCVQQHRSYVEAQPLADPAAQNLANRMDETGPVLPAPLPGENDL